MLKVLGFGMMMHDGTTMIPRLWFSVFFAKKRLLLSQGRHDDA